MTKIYFNYHAENNYNKYRFKVKFLNNTELEIYIQRKHYNKRYMTLRFQNFDGLVTYDKNHSTINDIKNIVESYIERKKEYFRNFENVTGLKYKGYTKSK